MRFKEKIKKIGNRKNCLLLALLILALLFTVFMPKINLGTQKASAQTRDNPFSGYYTVNNYRFSYQTSYNSLKQNGFFQNEYTTDMFMFQESAEGENLITIRKIVTDYTDSDNYQEILKDIFVFYDNNNVISYNLRNYRTASSSDSSGFIDVIDEGETSVPPTGISLINSDNNNKITINLKDLILKLTNISTSNNDLLTKSFQVQFGYVSENYNESNSNNDILFDNSIFYNYYLTLPINYTYEIKHFEGYKLRAISVTCTTNEPTSNFNFLSRRLDGYYSLETPSYAINTTTTYNDIDIYQDPSETAYIIGLTPVYLRDNTGNDAKNIYSGVYRMDYKNLEVGQTSVNYSLAYENTNNIEFGIVEPTPLITKVQQEKLFMQNYSYKAFTSNNESFDLYFEYLNNTLPPYRENKDYSLMKVLIPQSFNNAILDGIVETNLDFSIVENSIADKYTGLTFLGYQNEEIDLWTQLKSDFINMLNFAIDGAIFGAIIGLFFGNPLAGAGIGALIGAGVGLIPIFGDLLQAIGIENNIGDFIRNNVAPNLPGVFDNPYSTKKPKASLGLPLSVVVLIIAIIAFFFYLVSGA